VCLVAASDSENGNMSHRTFAHNWQSWQQHQECYDSNWLPYSLSWLKQKYQLYIWQMQPGFLFMWLF